MIFILPFLDLIDDPKDRAFFEELVTKNELLFIQLAYNKFQDYGYAEDAVSEMYLYMAMHFDRIKDSSYEEARRYMSMVVSSKANALREKMTRDILFDELPPEICDVEDVEDEFFKRYSEEMLVEALKQLDEKFSHALVYKYEYGLTSKEIGEIVGAHDVTVRRRTLTGKQRLKKILERMDKEDETDEQ